MSAESFRASPRQNMNDIDLTSARAKLRWRPITKRSDFRARALVASNTIRAIIDAEPTRFVKTFTGRASASLPSRTDFLTTQAPPGRVHGYLYQTNVARAFRAIVQRMDVNVHGPAVLERVRGHPPIRPRTRQTKTAGYPRAYCRLRRVRDRT